MGFTMNKQAQIYFSFTLVYQRSFVTYNWKRFDVKIWFAVGGMNVHNDTRHAQRWYIPFSWNLLRWLHETQDTPALPLKMRVLFSTTLHRTGQPKNSHHPYDSVLHTGACDKGFKGDSVSQYCRTRQAVHEGFFRQHTEWNCFQHWKCGEVINLEVKPPFLPQLLSRG